MTKQLGFLMNLDKCLGCRGCAMACQNERPHQTIAYRRITKLESHPQSFFGFLSMACNHCVYPACIRACPQGCFKKRRDGIVVHNPLRCTGCHTCTGACPFQVPRINPVTKKVEKCDFCLHRQEKGLKPACVEACIVNALKIINLSEELPEHYQADLPGFMALKLTKPATRFILPETQTVHRYWIKEE